MSYTVQQLAELVGGEAIGRVDVEIDGLRPLDQADPRHLSPLLRWRLLEGVRRSPGAVLARDRLAHNAVDAGVGAALVHDKPVLLLARLIDLFHPAAEPPGFVHPSAVVDESAQIDDTAWIGPGVVIEAGVTVGERCWIGPNAVICAGSQLGSYVRIGPGAVIGYEGFGFAPTPDGPIKVRQIGTVRIADFVEIGAGACVDRGALGETVVGAHTKIDNLVQVGHNTRIGERVLIAGQAGLAGSTVIGDDVMLGGQVGVADHRRVGARARVAAQGGVVGDIPADAIVAGTPAVPHRKWLRAMAQLLSAQFDRPAPEETEEP